MQQPSKPQKCTFSSLGKTCSQHHKSTVIIVIILAVFSSLYFFSSQPKKTMKNMEGMAMAMPEMNMTSFGPGDGHHIHKPVNPADFKHIANISKSATDLPPPLKRSSPKTVEINLTASEVVANIAPVISYHYWTFNDTVPGPFLRVRVGDTIKLSLHNDKSSSHDHSIDLHAVTGAGGGAALTEVKPGETKTMQFKTLNSGLFVYHCASGNAPTHIAMGMYGLILVEPEEGLSPVDREFYIMQGELYTKGMLGERGYQDFDGKKMINEQPEYIVFNGRPWSLVEAGEMKAKVGEKVRFFMGNAGVSKISSFHIIGEIFDHVYPEASMSPPLKNVQTTLVPAGGATITELQLDVPGGYVLVDHALARVDKGAWGILNVSGDKDNAIYSPIK